MADYGKGIGDQIDAIFRLAALGGLAIAILAGLTVAGALYAAWWAWHHVTVTVS